MPVASKVIVIGLDGLDPSIVDGMMEAGELRNLARLREEGGYSRIATTTPAQTPVAWSTFATGVNPGGHGIFDFLRRDPRTYLPDLALNRYEQKSAFLPPSVVNHRRGVPVWKVLSEAGIPSTVIRCPCTYPPDEIDGRMLSGMGVPDIRGGLGTPTFYSTDLTARSRESEHVEHLAGSCGRYTSRIVGPRNARQRSDVSVGFELELGDGGRGRISSDAGANVIQLRAGTWSDWLRIRFRAGLLSSTAGMVRFLLLGTDPHVELYASPVNFDPVAPVFPISHPPGYAAELSRELGSFYTTGMVEDHTGLSNDRFDEGTFVEQCELATGERERMMLYELDRFREGFFFCLFDAPDRVQHMFWRFRERTHPANGRRGAGGAGGAGDPAACADFTRVIEDQYARCDALVGRVLAAADDRTLVVALSDHGFSSFQRGVHLNAWLLAHGFLALKPGVEAGDEAGDFLSNVDWGRTRAYALGLGSVYLNVRGREGEGIVHPADVDDLSAELARGMSGLVDDERGEVAVRGVKSRRDLYAGAHAAESPDLVVEFSAGYRVSWATALGGVPRGLVEDNVRKWGGDHIVDPALVPGVLFMNRPFDDRRVRLLDMAPTLLSALGVPTPPSMEGASLLGGPAH